MRRPRSIGVSEARELAGQGLAFLAREPQRLVAFMTATGLSPHDLRTTADDDTTLAAILNHLLEDETLLLVFVSEAGVAPEVVAPAALVLSGRGAAS